MTVPTGRRLTTKCYTHKNTCRPVIRWRHLDPPCPGIHNVDWIGGSPCSGKSSIAEKLAARQDLRLIHTDDYLDPHTRQADADRHLVMHRQSQKTWNQIWMTPVEQLVKDEFEMLLDGQALNQDGGPLLVEGAALLPEQLERFQVRPGKAVTIIPTREFQVAVYSNRA